MTKYPHVLFLSLLWPLAITAQPFHNQRWLLENYLMLDFSGGGAPVATQVTPPVDLGPGLSVNSICDAAGNLLFYTGGCFIANRQHKLMENGDDINSEFALENCYGGSFPGLASNIALPFPEDSTRYVIFNVDLAAYVVGTHAYVNSPHLLYQVIDMTQDNGLGAVVEKNQVAVEDALVNGSLAAVRHANGRDWWVVVPKESSNCYYVVPFTPDGVGQPLLRCIGRAFNAEDGGGQASFSPDGTKYARSGAGNGMVVMDFDPLTGDFSNQVDIQYAYGNLFFHGCNFSGNSRYLYLTAYDRIYQIDTDADDLQASLTWVGGMFPDTLQPGQSSFGPSMLGPNGRIYISCRGTSKYFSSIDRPNCPGLECRARVHKIILPADNYLSNNTQPHYFVPQQDFNCDMPPSGTEEGLEPYRIAFWPNPASKWVQANFPKNGNLSVLGLDGRILGIHPVQAGPNRIPMPYPKGMYLLQFRDTHGRAVVERVVLH